MAASQLSWLNTRKAMDSTMVKLTQLDRHNLQHLALELPHLPHHLQLSLRATESLLHHRHHPLDRQELVMVQYLLRQACNCL